LQLIRVIGTHPSSNTGKKRSLGSRKQEAIYIGDSDSEEENEVLVTPTKRQRSPLDEDLKPRLKTPRTDVKPRWGLDQDLQPSSGLGRDVKTSDSTRRDIKPVVARRGITPDVKPMLTAMGQLSVCLDCHLIPASLYFLFTTIPSSPLYRLTSITPTLRFQL
jgi:hypothetical protein